MIVKILSSTGTFAAVRYNTDKMDRNSGELMRIRNFGLLDNDFALRPEEVRNYLKAVSALNKNVKKPQFHAAISCKGRELSKNELSDIAERWMDKMGYGKNPYIVVFHKDTPNNHVHIVSTRIGLDGKKVPDSFERLKAIRHLEHILKFEPGKEWEAGIAKILDFHVASPNQIKLLFEIAGFQIVENKGGLSISKGGRCIKEIQKDTLDAMIHNRQSDEKRLKQLKSIVRKYGKVFDSTLMPEYRALAGNRTGEVAGFKSELTDYLKVKFGLHFVFHFGKVNPPYGYSIIDNKGKAVFKGSQLMKLAELAPSIMATPNHAGKVGMSHQLDDFNIQGQAHIEILASENDIPAFKIKPNHREISSGQVEYYQDLLRFFLDNNSIQDLDKLDITPAQHSGKMYLIDNAAKNILDAKQVLTIKHYTDLIDQEISNQNRQPSGDTPLTIGWDISLDEDDEMIHGKDRNRDRRKNQNR